MDELDKLKENKRQFDCGEINENEYNKRKELILNKWLAEPSSGK
jgi:hypothetical protein